VELGSQITPSSAALTASQKAVIGAVPVTGVNAVEAAAGVNKLMAEAKTLSGGYGLRGRTSTRRAPLRKGSGKSSRRC
jgi:hypothetical protein